MKDNANPAVSAGDLPGLATALTQISKMGPPGYPNWSKIASDGAAAAQSGDLAGAKASCRTCHDQYKDKFKASPLRSKKI